MSAGPPGHFRGGAFGAAYLNEEPAALPFADVSAQLPQGVWTAEAV